MPQERRQIHVHNLYVPAEDLLQLTYFPPSVFPFSGAQLADDIVAGFNHENQGRTQLLSILNAREHLRFYAGFDDNRQEARLFRGFKWDIRLPTLGIGYLLSRNLSTEDFIAKCVIYESREGDWSWNRSHDRR